MVAVLPPHLTVVPPGPGPPPVWAGCTSIVTVPVSVPKPNSSKLRTTNESLPVKPWFGVYLNGSPANS
jgi:hypothetical protein